MNLPEKEIKNTLMITFHYWIEPTVIDNIYLGGDFVEIEFRDFVNSLLKRSDINSIIESLIKECNNKSFNKSVSEKSQLIYKLYTKLYGTPEFSFNDKFLRKSKEEAIDQIFSPRVVLSCIYLIKYGTVNLPVNRNTGCTTLFIGVIIISSFTIIAKEILQNL